ncbi:MAG: helix-turn-helix transcriptional regulator [Christensenellales bacterium]|jgi:transcriptional regulator with XRE-family HTH domain
MIDNKVVGQAIAKLRQAENMTQQTLAACLNISHQAVSKWETGAALPDVLTLLEISRMFGVTLEQLLAGDIEARLEKDQAEESPRVIELKLDKSGLSERVAEAVKEAGDAVRGEDDGAQETEINPEEFDIDKIIQMAPFMSREMIEEFVLKHSNTLTPKQLSRIAPFVGAECLEKLIVDSENVINWDTLRRLAPFLKKEVVDALTMAVAKGEKYVKPTAKILQKSTDEIGKTISKGINKALKFARQVGAQMSDDAINLQEKEQKKPVSRASEARSRIFERALKDERFDWIGAHIDQLEDDELKRRIADRAHELGMNDWVREHLSEQFDQSAVDDALLSGNWDYIAEHLDEIDGDTVDVIITAAIAEARWDWISQHVGKVELDDEIKTEMVQAALKAEQWAFLGEVLDELDLEEDDAQAIAEAAAQAGNWGFLDDHIGELEIEDIASDIALAAYDADERDLVIELVDEYSDEIDFSALMNKAMEKGDRDFIREMIEHADEDAANDICLALAGRGEIDFAAELAEYCDEDTVAQLIEMATESGSWEVIEKLNEHLG